MAGTQETAMDEMILNANDVHEGGVAIGGSSPFWGLTAAEGSTAMARIYRSALWGPTHPATRVDCATLFAVLQREHANGLVQIEWSGPADVGKSETNTHYH